MCSIFLQHQPNNTLITLIGGSREATLLSSVASPPSDFFVYDKANATKQKRRRWVNCVKRFANDFDWHFFMSNNLPRIVKLHVFMSRLILHVFLPFSLKINVSLNLLIHGKTYPQPWFLTKVLLSPPSFTFIYRCKYVCMCKLKVPYTWYSFHYCFYT